MHFQVKRKNNRNHSQTDLCEDFSELYYGLYVHLLVKKKLFFSMKIINNTGDFYCKSNLKIIFRNYYALNLHVNMQSLIHAFPIV
jgi:hypothetical protein